jgi:citrate synthase
VSATAEVQSGLEGVVAFVTEIAEPDREGGALRYRGVDIEDLVGNVPFEQVWGLLVDGSLLPGMPPAEPHPLYVHSGDPRVDVQSALAMLAPQWGFGHRIYRAEDPRARVLRRTARRLGSPRVEVAEALEQAALAELQARKPDRVLATNVEFWSAVVLDYADVPPELFTPLFTCARTAGWSAHIMEQKREGRLIRPTAKYVGPGPRPLSELRD